MTPKRQRESVSLGLCKLQRLAMGTAVNTWLSYLAEAWRGIIPIFTSIVVRDGSTPGQSVQRFHSSVWISNAIVHGGASD